MNILQNLDSATQYCVTLNRSGDIDPAKVLHRISLAHPQFTTAGLAAQERWGELARERTFYAGAYWFYGFHEDGYKSGLRAAEAIAAAAPRLASQRHLRPSLAGVGA